MIKFLPKIFFKACPFVLTDVVLPGLMVDDKIDEHNLFLLLEIESCFIGYNHGWDYWCGGLSHTRSRTASRIRGTSSRPFPCHRRNKKAAPTASYWRKYCERPLRR